MARGNFRNFKKSAGADFGSTEPEKRGAGRTGAGAGTTGTGRNDNNNSSTTTTTGTGTGAGAGAGTGTGEKAEEKLSEVSVLKVPDKKEIKKSPVKSEKPKRKKTQNKQKKDEKNTTEQISAVIQSVSMIAASREGMEHWAISKKEADSVAEPLFNVLSNLEVFSKAAEHSDAIALAIASVSIVVPRAIISVDKAKRKKEMKKRGIIQSERITEKADEKREDSGTNKPDNVRPAGFRSPVGIGIPATVSAVL